MRGDIDPETERSPHYQLGFAEGLVRRIVRQNGRLDEPTMAQAVAWLEDLERLDLSWHKRQQERSKSEPAETAT